MTQQESDWDKYKTFMDDMKKQMEILHVKFDFLINRISHLENQKCSCADRDGQLLKLLKKEKVENESD